MSAQSSADGIRRGVRAAVVVPLVARRPSVVETDEAADLARSAETRLSEAVGLGLAIDLDIRHQQAFILKQPKPATLIGGGKVDEIAALVDSEEIELVIVDHPLTPVQQRNLEREMKAKVIDRTGLILEIFGRRARTREGVLQVELAHLNYQKGRLVRSWTHLERQRGGGGGGASFLGGPGETQIETDRRLLQDKIDTLKRELEKVRQTRSLHRSGRKKIPHPVVALVGYTNAGKSTLFNRMTGSQVLAEDMLFATLDPTLRRLKLPRGTPAILSDTVGFISDLPTHLIAAFRATLEEVTEADLILHVRDIASADTQAQAADVRRILGELGLETEGGRVPVIEVWNKVDLLDPDQATRTGLLAARGDASGHPVMPVSAQTGQGVPELLAAIEDALGGTIERRRLRIPADAQAALPAIYGAARVVERHAHEDGSLELEIEATHQAFGQLARLKGVRLSDPV
ncbi:MAG: GTPase HflX [Rhizobiaceae bacterium]|jgi:GTP-binding protein HflX|nr:GTPase HflX [Rhizobiaceae bacterium]